MDEWLDDILQDELDDEKQQLLQLEGDDYSFAAVKMNHKFRFDVGIVCNRMGRDMFAASRWYEREITTFNHYIFVLVRAQKETGIQGHLIMHCKSTRTEHIVLVINLKNSGVGLGSTICNHTILSYNGK